MNNTQNESTILDLSTLRWIKFSALAASLVGLGCLFALLSHDAWSADAKSGLQGGARPFTSPFSGGPAAGGGFFDDEDEEFDFPEERPGGMAPKPFGGPNSAVQAPQMDFGGGKASGGSMGGVSVGGTQGGGVISHNNVPPLKVDDETGEGSKEVITDFNFPDADIMDIAKTLGKLTGKNFILDKDVKGRVTIISNGPITVGDAWRAFLTALDMNNFALIPSGKYIRIARQRDARDKQLKTYTGDYSPDTDALITRVFQLKYISAEEVSRTFRSFMPANSRIYPYEQTNTIIVTDTGSNIAKLAKILEILDIEGYDAGIEVISVKYASAVELSKLIDTLLPGTSTGPAGMPKFGGGGIGGSRFNARRTKEGGVINAIIGDERTNTLIVHANGKGVEQVRELVAKLDQKLPSNKGGGRIHVVYLQFADAEAIGNTLNNLSSGQKSAAMPMTLGPGAGTGINPVANSLFEGAIKVAPDKATNSLVITASPSDFVTVQRVINRLDIPRNEVYVEVVVMEVNAGKSFEFNTNVISPSSGMGFTPTQDLAKTISTGGVGVPGVLLGFKAGSEQSVTVNNQSYKISSVQGLVKILQTQSKANILATPQIIALDNADATFESSEKIPVETTTAVQGGAVSSSLTKESVTLSIKIKPQINKLSNFVKLDVEAKMEDLSGRNVPAALEGRGFATVSRNVKTTVVVGDSDTVVLGGLVRDKSSEVVTKVPLLGDIPILGWLFSARQRNTEKTNLLIFLTPHIIRQYDKVRSVLDKKLRQRDEFLEKNMGGDDPFRESRDDIIRSLPDIDELSRSKPNSTVTLDDDESDGTPVKSGLGVTPPASAAVPAGPVAPAAPQADAFPSAPVPPAAPDMGTSAPPPPAPTAPASPLNPPIVN